MNDTSTATTSLDDLTATAITVLEKRMRYAHGRSLSSHRNTRWLAVRELREAACFLALLRQHQIHGRCTTLTVVLDTILPGCLEGTS